MQLPNTTHAAYIYAFKKGYRMAMEGKPLSFMPSEIRRDEQMRQYFQMGWDQFQEALANGEELEEKTPWRTRFAWTFMAIIAGLGTASLMIHQMQPAQAPQETASHLPAQPPANSNTEKTREVAKIPSPALSKNETITQKPSIEPKEAQLRLLPPPHQASKQTADNATTVTKQPSAPTQPEINPQSAPAPQAETLALLNPEARSDLKQLKQQNAQKSAQFAFSPLVKSPIHIKQAVLAENVKNRQPIHPLNSPVPKYIRQVYFFTQIENAKGQTIYHRWIYKNQIMAQVMLKINSPLYRTWSSKRLSSRWAGEWTIEILDADKQPIYRYQFHYETFHEGDAS